MAPANTASNVSSTHLPTIPLQINGKELTTKTTFPVVNPTTGKVIWNSCAASKEDAIHAAEAAHNAFASWSKTKPQFRRDIFLKAAAIVERRSEELGEYMMLEMGAPASFAGGFNIPNSAEMLKDIAGRIVAVSASVPICAGGTNSIVYREPYGVVLGIAPWNAPYILGFRAVAYAIAVGNTAVLRAPEFSTRCYWAIGSVFAEAGLPAGVLNVLAHRTEDAAVITNTLIAHPVVKKICFTGSTAVGALVAAEAGKHLKPTLMELGGKASAIVLEDADLEAAATQCALGAFLNGGQVCMATERILVHSSVLQTFTPLLHRAITQLFHSGPASALIKPASVIKVQGLITSALAAGAKISHGSLDDPPHPTDVVPSDGSGVGKFEGGNPMRPVVLSGVTDEMDIYRQESFGPVVCLMPIESDEEAVRIANDTEYGLSAAVFSRDLGRALRIAGEIESGAVHINSMTIHDEPNLPHGGVKKSGWGRFNAQAGLDEFLRSKTVTWAA